MPIYRLKTPVIAAIACSGVALMLQFVAVAGIGWIVSEKKNVGLFRSCNYNKMHYTCGTLTADTDYWRVCQAFSLLGEATIFASLAIGVLHTFREDTERLTAAAVVLNVVSAVFLIIEVSVFAGNASAIIYATDIKRFFGYGFYLSIWAAVLSVVSAILYIVGSFVTSLPPGRHEY